MFYSTFSRTFELLQQTPKRFRAHATLAVCSVCCAGQFACLSVELGSSEGSALPPTTPDVEEELTDEDSETSNNNSEDVPISSCNGWKIAFCDSVDACDAFTTRSECEADVGYIECKSNVDFGQCVYDINQAIDSATCNQLPANCRPKDIADRTTPTAACEAIADSYCEWTLTCGGLETYDTCRARLSLEQPCSDYLAVQPGLEDCLAAYLRHPCISEIPTECSGLLRK